MHQKQKSGFNLIEIIIVIAIIGTLAAIAYPSYVTFIMKSRRADALAALVQDQTNLERCYAQNFSYNTTCIFLPSFPHKSAQGFYSISLHHLGSSSYVLSATAIGSQINDISCRQFNINQANVKSAINATGMLQNTC